METLEQKRASFALRKIDLVKEREKKDQSKFKTQLLKLPARLHSNGLGQTVAFYMSAGPKKPETEICGWIDEWLRERLKLSGTLLDCVTGRIPAPGSPEQVYREASVETRALAVWLKRFAEAFIEGSPE